ncbi:hypothetical protein BJ138DRAFT_1238818 [Hygrophoropsis aurantiaca]|uniref:Uncharacterized protein n=1 Tax=Hygrophoropsis aurantiaca TaxID=72124 RepID=A0ACB7ZU69_9AGAM|nr:hypothetical protein BJ138DRAFT_1238818 [Hygrophoropsis aurantiaca]
MQAWDLRVLHFFYVVIIFLASFLKSLRRIQSLPLAAQRRKLPSHLCLLLVSDSEPDAEAETERAFLESVQRVVAWCRTLGIASLTAYDNEGVLVRCSEIIRERMVVTLRESFDNESTDLAVKPECPIMSPLSEPSSSRSHSPDPEKLPIELNVVTIQSSESRIRANPIKCEDTAPRANPLTLYLTSRHSSKPAIAAAARSLTQRKTLKGKSCSDYALSIAGLNDVLEEVLPSPDFMIVHHVSPTRHPRPSLELHGFPPWQITLTEIHRTRAVTESWLTWPFTSAQSKCTVAIDEMAFCRALDEFAVTETRRGK